FGTCDRYKGWQAGDHEAGPCALDVDRVTGIGAGDNDGVGQGVARAATRRGGKVEVEVGEVGAGQVVDRDGVRAAQGVEVDPLDAVEVHHDTGDAGAEADARAVGGDVDPLADIRAVEEHRVGAGLSLDDVAAVAGIPDERVVAGTHPDHV